MGIGKIIKAGLAGKMGNNHHRRCAFFLGWCDYFSNFRNLSFTFWGKCLQISK